MNKAKKSRIRTMSIIGVSVLALATGLTIAANMNGKNLDLLFPEKAPSPIPEAVFPQTISTSR